MNKSIIYVVFLTLVFAACDMKEDYEQIDSKAVEYAGEWYIQYLNADMDVIYSYQVLGDLTLLTYNTAADAENEIWIDDQDEIFPMKFKAVIDGDMTSFSAPKIENMYGSDKPSYPGSNTALNVTDVAHYDYSAYEVMNGKIILGAATSKDGNTVDSLYLSMSFYRNEFPIITEIKEIDTTWNKIKTDSSFKWDVAKLDSLVLTDTTYYKWDSTQVWSFVYDSTVKDIDTSYSWKRTGDNIEVKYDRVISGHRYSGFVEDMY